MQQANDRNEAKDGKSDVQKRFEAADNTGRLAGNNQNTKVAREEAMDDIAHDPDLNNNDPFQDLDEGEAARMGAKDNKG